MNPNISVNTNTEQQKFGFKEEPMSAGRAIYSIFHMMMFVLAIYLSFKCNGQFELGPFLAACCCPYFYIIYVFAARGGCGILGDKK